jgi:uncharacterized protein YaaQ
MGDRRRGSMKMVVVIVQSADARSLLNGLMERGFRATMVASTGGFLREGNATIFIGTEWVEEAMRVIGQNCHTRTQLVNPLPLVMEPGELYMPHPIEVQVGGAIIFVLDVERFERF